MSKYTIIGDLHFRPVWKDIVEKEFDSDKIIFLGDYIPHKEVEPDDPTDECGFLYEVLDYKDQHDEQIVLLRGNHCVEALGYYWAECYPPVHSKVALYCQTEDVKNWFLNNTQWIYQIPDTKIICSHAGISKEFLSNCSKKIFQSKGYTDPQNILRIINNIEPCELFGFTPDHYGDETGESASQPCTWIRPYTLSLYGIEGYTQIVGHTPCKHIFNVKQELELRKKEVDPEGKYYPKVDYCDIWCCDCLENREYLVIENGEFRIKNI